MSFVSKCSDENGSELETVVTEEVEGSKESVRAPLSLVCAHAPQVVQGLH
jgi:hypothetical protein